MFRPIGSPLRSTGKPKTWTCPLPWRHIDVSDSGRRGVRAYLDGWRSRARRTHSASLAGDGRGRLGGQEQRRGRTPLSPQAIRDALTAAGRLLDHLDRKAAVAKLGTFSGRLNALRRRVDAVESLDEPARLDLYQDSRHLARELALANPLLAGRAAGVHEAAPLHLANVARVLGLLLRLRRHRRRRRVRARQAGATRPRHATW